MKIGVLLLGGVIAAGKTSLAEALVKKHGFLRVSTRRRLEHRANDLGLIPTRSILQQMGDELDAETGGLWVLDEIDRVATLEPDRPLLLDSVRRDFQIHRARERWPERALYVHLSVPYDVARTRYNVRRTATLQSDAEVTFEQAKNSATEKHAETLVELANLVLDTHGLDPEAAAERAAGFFARSMGKD